MQKLVDNDKYIDRKLKYDESYIIGPKKKTSTDSAIDNYKFFDGIDGISNQLSIV